MDVEFICDINGKTRKVKGKIGETKFQEDVYIMYLRPGTLCVLPHIYLRPGTILPHNVDSNYFGIYKDLTHNVAMIDCYGSKQLFSHNEEFGAPTMDLRGFAEPIVCDEVPELNDIDAGSKFLLANLMRQIEGSELCYFVDNCDELMATASEGNSVPSDRPNRLHRFILY